MVFSCSLIASLIELSLHLTFNSQIVLECGYFVLTLRTLCDTCGLEGKSSKATKVSIVLILWSAHKRSKPVHLASYLLLNL